MKLLIFGFVAHASAFPFVASTLGASQLNTRQSAETNCGPTPCVTFDATEQYVDVSPGSGHEFIMPTTKDRRGPCPGLNAAANHGFIPRSGILTTAQTVTGLAQAFGMGADLAAGLAVISIVLEGDPINLLWSIGGPFVGSILDTLGEQPQGISYSHNNYEGDGSVTRADAYLNNGDSSTLILSRFQTLYDSAETYTLEGIRSMYAQNQQDSIAQNPYFFNAQFSGILVVPAAHNFIINFFSNHSAEQPNGFLDRNVLKQFFAISGKSGSFVYTPGAERIPKNWWRRPTSDQYTLARAVADVATMYAEYPSTLKLGGNTNGVNTFTGVDIGNLTGGIFNSETLLEGNNLGCFILLAQQEDFPDSLKGLEGSLLSPITNLIANNFLPLLKQLECPQLESYNQGLFNQFPGYKYDPKAPSS